MRSFFILAVALACVACNEGDGSAGGLPKLEADQLNAAAELLDEPEDTANFGANASPNGPVVPPR